MSSAVKICNEALLRVGAKTITSLDDDTTEAKVCKVVYKSERDELLDEYDWRFATICISLPTSKGSVKPTRPMRAHGVSFGQGGVRPVPPEKPLALHVDLAERSYW